MKRKHIIVRTTHAALRDPFARRFFGVLQAPEPPSVKIEVDNLNERDVAQLNNDPSVDLVVPSMPMKLMKPTEVAAADVAGATTTWGVKAVKADTSSATGEGMIVAVLDTGIDPNHPAFAGVNLVRRNFTKEADDDVHGHGTHCAGTIFGRDVNGLRIGVARGVKKALIGKVLGDGGGSSESIVSAINWAVDNGANVISMSLGIDFPGFVAELITQGVPGELATSMALDGYRANVALFGHLASTIRAMAEFRQPTLLVAAAGNESQRQVNPDFEIFVSPPAVSEGILSVAAIGEGAGGFKIADFSNTGANVSGPGVKVISAKPGGGLQTMSGTSMATPHLAGLAALWGDQIAKTRPLKLSEWLGRIVGSAKNDRFVAGTDPSDVGAGLAEAPQA